MKDILLVPHRRSLVVITHILLVLLSHLTSRTERPVCLHGSKSGTDNRAKEVMAKPPITSSNRLRIQSSINDNYCVKCVAAQEECVHVSGKVDQLNFVPVLAREKDLSVTSKRKAVYYLHVNSCVVNPVHFAKGYPQKKGVNPDNGHHTEIKFVKDVSCVGYLSCVNLVIDVTTVAPDVPVGARLHQLWEKWAALGVSPKVVTVLREGYTLPFRFRPNFTRSPTIISCYVNPQKNLYLLEALLQLLNKNAVEPVATRKSLGFYNRLILVPKPSNWWRPILHLSTLNTFLNTESFKMETPELIRTSLQAGEWVTSINFKDACFHIPIQSQSQKYMCCHVQGQSYQFKALPFGLPTAPMEFRVVANEVKLLALQRGIRIHQYLDDWLVRARSNQTCLQHTQTLVALYRELGWLVNREKSELDPKQVSTS